MDWYAIGKKYYDMGIYNTDPTSSMYLGNFVAAGKITPEQYFEITGQEYVA